MERKTGCYSKNMKKISIFEILLISFLISGCTLTIGTKYPEKKTKTSTKTPAAKKQEAPKIQGTIHTVRKGENLYRISLYYEVPMQDIRKANNMDSDNVFVGQKLFIPGTTKKPPLVALTPDTKIECPVPEPKQAEQPVSETKILKESDFIWPVEGKIICNYGELGNKGIDILTQPSSPVKAAKDGKIAFVGSTTKYGETIIIEHENNVFTVYGHDLIIKVKQGQTVKKGQVIGEMKNSTSARRYLHFEIRIGNQAVNPFNYLQREK